MLDDAGLRPYRADVAVVTSDRSRMRNGAAAPVILVRPDGYVAASGRLGDLRAVTAYLRGLLVASPAGAAQQRGMGLL